MEEDSAAGGLAQGKDDGERKILAEAMAWKLLAAAQPAFLLARAERLTDT